MPAVPPSYHIFEKRKLAPKLEISNRETIKGPAHLTCKLCGLVMSQPVIEATGLTYDYDCLERHLVAAFREKHSSWVDSLREKHEVSWEMSRTIDNLLAREAIEAFLFVDEFDRWVRNLS